MLSRDKIEKIKKKRHKEFCTWERKVQTEIKRAKKTNKRDKNAMHEFLSVERIGNLSRISNSENLTETTDKTDVLMAVKEGAWSLNGG